MTRSTYAMCVGLMLSASAAPISAQASAGSFAHLGIMGGASIPFGGFAFGQKVGWNGGALVDFRTPLPALSFRVEGQWHQMDGHTEPDGGPCEGCTTFTKRTDVRIIDVTGDALYDLPTTLPVKFYVIGGGGAYNVRMRHLNTSTFDEETQSELTSESGTKFGINGGVGAKFQLNGFATFIEARYVFIVHGARVGNFICGTDGGCGEDDRPTLQMMPITIGITF